MEFLHSKFGNRIISRNSEHSWPPNSPNLSCLDFSFWSVVTTHIIQCEPKTLQELKELVEDFARNMDEDMVRRMARHTRDGEPSSAVRNEGATSSTCCRQLVVRKKTTVVWCEMSHNDGLKRMLFIYFAVNTDGY